MDVAGPDCGGGARADLGWEFFEDEAEVGGAFAAGWGSVGFGFVGFMWVGIWAEGFGERWRMRSGERSTNQGYRRAKR